MPSEVPFVGASVSVQWALLYDNKRTESLGEGESVPIASGLWRGHKLPKCAYRSGRAIRRTTRVVSGVL
jgi:hypothetical protein